jgi:hypothetical protein
MFRLSVHTAITGIMSILGVSEDFKFQVVDDSVFHATDGDWGCYDWPTHEGSLGGARTISR